MWRVLVTINENKAAAEYYLDYKMTQFIKELSVIDNKLDALISLTFSEQGVSDFERAAQYICQDDAIYGMYIAPDGIIEHVYPDNDPDFIVGRNVIDCDDEKDIGVVNALIRNKAVLSGPFYLDDGNQYLFLSKPIYIKETVDTPYYWGIVTVCVKFPDVLINSGIEDIATSGYNVRLDVTDINNESITLADYGSQYITSSVSKSTNMFMVDFDMKIQPVKGWFSSKILLEGIIIELIISSFMAIHIIDFKKVKRSQLRLKKIVEIDTLTGAKTRRALHQIVEEQIERQHTFALAYIDVDKFKYVNDTYGHDAGDILLKEIVKRIAAIIRDNDFIARIGGDEFVVYLDGVSHEEGAKASVGRIQATMDEKVSIGDNMINASISVGCVRYPAEGSTMDEIIKCADKKMYEMKERHHKEQ